MSQRTLNSLPANASISTPAAVNVLKPVPRNPEGMKPGVTHGKRVYPKANTCANSSLKKRAARALAGIEKHLEKNPDDAMASARASKLRAII